MTAWDVSGCTQIRPMDRGSRTTDGFVFVIDSSDRDRLDQALEELKASAGYQGRLRPVPALIPANKQDLPGVLIPAQLNNQIKDNNYLQDGQPWSVFGTTATSPGDGDGLVEAMTWLDDVITQQRKYRLYYRLAGIAEKSKTIVKADSKECENGAARTLNEKATSSQVSYWEEIVLSLKHMCIGPEQPHKHSMNRTFKKRNI